MKPTVSQVRREFDRRIHPSRGYTPCRGLRHRLTMRRLRRWDTVALRHFVYRAQCRLDPPSAFVDPCSCSGGKVTTRW